MSAEAIAQARLAQMDMVAINVIMLFIGALGLIFSYFPDSRRWRIAGAVWFAFWAAPPLVRIWLKSVVG